MPNCKQHKVVPDATAASVLPEIQARVLPKSLVGTHYKSLGSIEGRIELVSVHKGSKRFTLYHIRTGKAIKCNLPPEVEADVWSAAEQRRRVGVSGLISYNIIGEPLSVLVKGPLRFFKTEEELPTSEKLAGIAPDITGDLSTEDFVRSLRDGPSRNQIEDDMPDDPEAYYNERAERMP